MMLAYDPVPMESGVLDFEVAGMLMAKNGQTNKFCSLKNMRNESDVEQTFIRRLLEDLGYTDDYIETKATAAQLNIGKQRKPRLYKPDFICFLDKKHKLPVITVDGKHPTADAEEGCADAQLYAAVMRRTLASPKPDQVCIGSNGHGTLVKHHDSDQNLFNLAFSDFVDANSDFNCEIASNCIS